MTEISLRADGVTVQTVQDRSELLHRAIDTLKRTRVEEAISVAIVAGLLPIMSGRGSGSER